MPNPQSQEGTVPDELSRVFDCADRLDTSWRLSTGLTQGMVNEARRAAQRQADRLNEATKDFEERLKAQEQAAQLQLSDLKEQLENSEARVRLLQQRSGPKAVEAALAERDRQVREQVERCIDDEVHHLSVNVRTQVASELEELLALTQPSSTPLQQEPEVGGDECKRPPRGWRCTRQVGHDGPCAAVPAAEGSDRLEAASAAARAWMLDHDLEGYWFASLAADVLAAADRVTLSDEAVRELTKQIVEGSDGEVISLPYQVVKDALADVLHQRSLPQPEAYPEVPRCGANTIQVVRRDSDQILWARRLPNGPWHRLDDLLPPYCATCEDHQYVPYPENPVVGMHCPDCRSTPELLGEEEEQFRVIAGGEVFGEEKLKTLAEAQAEAAVAADLGLTPTVEVRTVAASAWAEAEGDDD